MILGRKASRVVYWCAMFLVNAALSLAVWGARRCPRAYLAEVATTSVMVATGLTAFNLRRVPDRHVAGGGGSGAGPVPGSGNSDSAEDLGDSSAPCG